ncbi:hypothetical protein B484DRAFT_438315 [Ochromonadaceae sp. CCMP2298]|nr:hypothetical protein B484DRAFT_438315 [Ochromonadaceae sp. CCMP2298]
MSVDVIRKPVPFQVYRPPQSTGRLEGTYRVDTIGWRPSLSYHHGLEDVKKQFTPAEAFRHALATSGQHIRMIQRLEIRMNRHHVVWSRAALRIQALHQGNVSRAYFKAIKDQLEVDRRKRMALATSTSLFLEGRFKDTVQEVNDNPPATVELWTIKCKSLYRLQRYESCIESCLELTEMDSLVEDSFFLQGCCFSSMGDFDSAYKALKIAVINIEDPRPDTLRLCAYVATKIQPPRYLEAVDSYGPIIKSNMHDFEAMWGAGIADLTFVLVWVPTHLTALLMRARAYACIRNWSAARADYRSILLRRPDDEGALQGLVDVQDTVIVLPMLDDNMIDNES